MAFKLSKADMERRDELYNELEALEKELDGAITAFNEAIESLKAPVTAALEAYNAKLEDVRGFAEDIAREADEEISEKSEKWQEGERGQAAASWKDEWENADFSDFEIELPDELSSDLPGHHETLSNLPEEAETA